MTFQCNMTSRNYHEMVIQLIPEWWLLSSVIWPAVITMIYESHIQKMYCFCLPGFSVTAPWVFNCHSDENWNKVVIYIMIIIMNWPFFLVNAHGVLRWMGARSTMYIQDRAMWRNYIPNFVLKHMDAFLHCILFKLELYYMYMCVYI